MSEHPDEKLRQGLRLIEISYEEKSRLADHELNQLRSLNKERQGQVAVLEARVGELEAQLREAADRASHAANERDLVRGELKAMQRDMAKLDQFKRSILQSIKDEDAPTVRPSTCLSNEPSYTAPAPHYGYSGAALSSQYNSQIRASPTPPPYVESYRPTSFSSAPPRASMTQRGGSMGPPSTPACGEQMMPLRAPSPPSLPAAPPSSSTAHVDGKDFFKAARLRLSYEQFNTFLVNIRSLNDRLQTQDETLAQAREHPAG